MVFKFLATNITIMLALGLLHGILVGGKRRDAVLSKLLHGLFFAAATVMVMLNSYKFDSGVFFDCRTVILGVAGMFCGPLVAFVAVFITAFYRYLIGGYGVVMGISTSVSATLIGVWFYYLREKRPYLSRPAYLYLFGLIIHVVMLVFVLALPSSQIVDVYKQITLPVILLFPIAVVLFGRLLAEQQEKATVNQRLLSEIEERKKTEKQLLFQSSILDQIGDLVTATDLDGEIIYVNNAECRKFANSKEDLIGKFVGIYSNESREEPGEQSKIIEETLKNGSWKGEIVNYDKDGKPYPVECRTFVVRDDNGEPSAFVGLATDITERKKAQQTIINQANRLNAILKTLPNMLFILSKEGVCCEFYASEGDKLLMPREKIVGSNLRDVFGKQQSEQHLRHIRNCIDNAELTEYEYSAVINDGARWFETRMARFDDEHVLATVTDITERKQAEHKLRLANKSLRKASSKAALLAAKAEAANKVKSQFLANMSHELRTPLNSILGFGEILAKENLEPRISEFVDIIRKQGSMLLGLVNDILDFVVIETGKLRIDFDDVKVADVVSLLEATFAGIAKDKGLDFEVVCGNDVPEVIRTDCDRLNQCLTNLINNSIKFTNSGKVCLKVRAESIDCKMYVRFDVEDTGIGIPEDKKEAVFDVFMQADFSNTRKFGGTGLGLPIVRHITDMLGGKLSFTSKEGSGSVFSIMIPCAPEQQNAGENFKKDQNPQRQEIASLEGVKLEGTALIVEDSPVNQKLLEIMLKKFGFKVLTAADGVEALEQVDKNDFDVIYMDIQMPRMNGYDATKKIKRRGIDAPIIAVTAAAMEEDRAKCIKAGCDGYISKPINRQKLFEITAKLLLKATERKLPDKNKLKLRH